jgi:DNA-binding GntR family transcriptional regulator
MEIPHADLPGHGDTAMILSRSGPRAYVKLAARPAEEIKAGTYAIGDQLPAIDTLRDENGISRQTAGTSLRVLCAGGLIERFPGLGYFVANWQPKSAGTDAPEERQRR